MQAPVAIKDSVSDFVRSLVQEKFESLKVKVVFVSSLSLAELSRISCFLVEVPVMYLFIDSSLGLGLLENLIKQFCISL